jgi:hypothetical protein
MARGKSTLGLRDKRRTLEYKLARRSALNKMHGQPEGWASDALDIYLEGSSIADIAGMMNVTSASVGAAIAKEALYRLMAQQQCERLEEMHIGKREGNEHGQD